MSDPRPCRLCGRLVRYRRAPGGRGEHTRYTYRHRCPHGNWCRAGEKLTGNAHASTCCSPWARDEDSKKDGST